MDMSEKRVDNGLPRPSSVDVVASMWRWSSLTSPRTKNSFNKRAKVSPNVHRLGRRRNLANTLAVGLGGLQFLIASYWFRETCLGSNSSTQMQPLVTMPTATHTKRSDRGAYRHSINPQYNSANVRLSCSEDQTAKITDMLVVGQGIENETRCPESTWIDRYYKRMHRRRAMVMAGAPVAENSNDGDSFLGISIGCNKGYDALNMARMGTANPKFDKRAWSEALDSLGVTEPGACHARSVRQFELDGDGGGNVASAPPRHGEVHCVEPMPSTTLALRGAARATGLNNGGEFTIAHVAISSRDGMVLFPDIQRAGHEAYGLARCQNHDPPGVNCREVVMHSLETYVELHVRGTGPINVLYVDVEGYDFDVIFGAGSVLDRTEYLEFEYHSKGAWARRHVTDATDLLDSKGFSCYWAGRGRLWRITGCHINYYEDWHGWSNVACVHRSQVELAGLMEDTFMETLRD